MKHQLIIVTILLAACGSNGINPVSTSANSNSQASNDANAGTTTNNQSNGIIGEWRLKFIAGDKNGNKILDDNERKEASKGEMDDYMRFNADGSCEVTIHKLQGKYEIKEEKGISRLFIYSGNNLGNKNYLIGKYRIGTITKDELVLLQMFGGTDFMVYKRL